MNSENFFKKNGFSRVGGRSFILSVRSQVMTKNDLIHEPYMSHLGIANRVKTITEVNSEKVCQKVTVHDKVDT